MIKAFVLVVIYNAPYGHAVSFQEFNTLKQCETNAEYLKNNYVIRSAYYTGK
jgi:hypothetical protein